jgi:glycosyltransferase involved in cell wall biosynthesis
MKWIATMHNSWRAYLYSHDAEGNPLNKYYQLARYALGERWSTRNCERIVNVADATGREWRKTGIPQAKMRTIHNGRFAPSHERTPLLRSNDWGIPQSAKIVGSLGYFDRRKGFDLLLQAFLAMAGEHPDAYLVLAGGDISEISDVRAALKQSSEQSRFADRIRILGPQPSGYEFLSKLDVFVNASRQEAFALVICEAMHLGLPCVVSSAGGNPEAIRHGLDGVVFESGNITDLAGKLEQILAEPDSARAMGESGRKRAHEYLTLERCARDYLNLYDEVMNSR